MTPREIDALVAEKVMGYKLIDSQFAHIYTFFEKLILVPVKCGDAVIGELGAKIPNYSTEISSAWEVVEKMRERLFHVNVDMTSKMVRVGITRVGNNRTTETFWGKHESAPLAICLAAIKAVGCEAK